MEKAYSPESFEDRLYQWWEKQGHFKASDVTDPKKHPAGAFNIMIPPPNVTGALHNGHALFLTLQDILIRWKRMSGFNTLWLPGTDHAGIATQMMVEKDLAKEGKSRHQLGRKAFLQRVWAWKEKHGGVITKQIRVMGASVDWERERFTMDEGLSKSVREVFVRLYEDKVIYRGSYIINWCHRCQTALSDLEVIPKERKGHLWHLRYPVVGSKDSLIIATTRPETMLGDTAVAVNPADERYRHLVGKNVKLPLVDREIPIVGDEHVDMAFGTGALKVTPGHDFHDYEIGKRHKLPILNLLGKDGTLNELAGHYKGLKVGEARERVVADLETAGALVKIEDHTSQVGTCERCEAVVEPLVSVQWFAKGDILGKPALDAVKRGEKMSGREVDSRTDSVKIYPESWTSTYYHFMENIKDWCISRQLWWGHQIPAWYCDKCNHIEVSRSDPSKCPKCGNADSASFRRDEDVLDTWFSSALWPFSTLGWPENTAALKTFYTGSVLETGTDILFFWVARMVMMGMYFMEGRVPFHRVYLHSLVRDEKGQKMSKTKGNVIDPLVVVAEHGADAFRFTLASMAGPNRDIRLSIARVAEDRAFCNKLWNASRYVLMRLGAVPPPVDETTGKAVPGIGPSAGGVVDFNAITGGKTLEQWVETHREEFHPLNRWVISQLQDAVVRTEEGLEEFRVNDATAAMYQFTWGTFCDWYIEYSKALLAVDGPGRGDAKLTNETYVCLLYVLETQLRLAHPFIPFITEEIWAHLPPRPGVNKGDALMVAAYPKARAKWVDQGADHDVGVWTDIIARIRTFRGENNIAPKARPEMTYALLPTAAQEAGGVKAGTDYIKAVAQLGSFAAEIGRLKDDPATGEIVTNTAKLYIPLHGLVDFGAERKRLEKELAAAQKDIEFFEKKLSNEAFVAKAPPELIIEQKAKLVAAQQKLAEVRKSQSRIAKL